MGKTKTDLKTNQNIIAEKGTDRQTGRQTTERRRRRKEEQEEEEEEEKEDFLIFFKRPSEASNMGQKQQNLAN